MIERWDVHFKIVHRRFEASLKLKVWSVRRKDG